LTFRKCFANPESENLKIVAFSLQILIQSRFRQNKIDSEKRFNF